MKLLEDLNQVQRDAVTHTEGPLLILAGAGSGKTRVLTYRIAYLLKEKGVHPQSILAITFTNKAAGEMKERVEQLIGPVASTMWVMTFHSACARILRQEIHRLGYKKAFVIYDADDQRRLVSACLKDLNHDIKRYSPSAIANLISTAKNELVDAETFSSRAQTYFDTIAAEVYRLYQQRLFQSNALDFDDLIMLTVNLFELFPNVLENYQNRFQYILVDEYQDTNHSQYKLISLLAGQHHNLCVVGDDDQSIYQFRGADIRNILDFESDLAEARVIKLEQNYRSTQTILEAANSVIQNNRGRKGKTLWTSNVRGDAVSHYRAENEHDEAVFVASTIEQLSKAEDRRYHDFAIFYRTNAQSRVFEDVFLRYGLPYKIVGGLRFYERQEIKDLLAYLRAVLSPDDTISLKRIINNPRRRIGKSTIEHIERFALQNNFSFYQALVDVENNPYLDDRARSDVRKFLELMDDLRGSKETLDLTLFVQELLDKSGYLSYLESERTVEAQGRLENLKEFISVTREFQTNYPGSGLEEFLEQVSLITDIDTYDERDESITLMTLHNAKGLEFPVVFIVGMEEGVFPHSRSMTSVSELEEERRLCYVGLTRAKERIYLTNAWSRSLWGGTNYNMESRFLKEIPDDLFAQATVDESQTRPPVQADLDFAVGDEVVHKKFGRGKITTIKDSNQVTVLFHGEGEKILLLDYAPLEKA